jgi:hypothetical protein
MHTIKKEKQIPVITLTYIDRTIHWCCNGVLASYVTTYTLTKLCVKSVYVFWIYIGTPWRWLQKVAETCRSGYLYTKKCHLLLINLFIISDEIFLGSHFRQVFQVPEPLNSVTAKTKRVTNEPRQRCFLPYPLQLISPIIPPLDLLNFSNWKCR